MHRFHHWRVRIQDARTERAIAQVVQDYRLTLSPAMVESLPEPCREAVHNPDLASAAITLLQCETAFRGVPEVAALLHEIAHTFAAAAVKLAGLRARVGS